MHKNNVKFNASKEYDKIYSKKSKSQSLGKMSNMSSVIISNPLPIRTLTHTS